MAYDEGLAERVREALADQTDVVEKAMFGGLGFLISGNMCCGLHGTDELVVRVGPDRYDEALARPHARVFDVTGRPMKGWVMVAPEGYEADADLVDWVQRGTTFARTLPPK